jgi:hypothetical protein
MKDRPPFSSFGEIAANPEGQQFCQLPIELFGDISKALQFAYLAFLRAWNNLTLTDASRSEFLKLINEEREKKGRAPITNLRTITWYFAVFKALGVIARKHDKENDIWITESTMPVRSQLPVGPKPAPNVVIATPDVVPQPVVQPESEVREESAKSITRTMAGFKWYVLLNDQGEPLLNADGQLDWKKGADFTEPWGLWSYVRKLDEDIRALIARDPDYRAMIEAARPARE